MRLNSSLFFFLVLSTSHGMASDWNEIGEAGGFPGQAPQITTAEDTLDSISGMLTMGSLMRFNSSHVNGGDCFHPSEVGHELLAEKAWCSSKWSTEDQARIP